MPELPDVEVYKQYLDATSLHQRIEHSHVPDLQILQEVSRQALAAHLRGSTLDRTQRHGKHLGAALSGGGWLVLHFGMTGWLRYFKDEEDEPKHTKLRLDFDNGFHLAYVCVRKIGFVGFCDDFDAYVDAKQLGPDALNLGLDAFQRLLEGRRGSVKSTLMNQHVLAGLGNVYSDEVLFQSGIHPKRKVTDLTNKEIEALHEAMKSVLRQTIRYKADPEAAPKTWLLSHRDLDDACPRCGGSIEKVEIAGRRAYVCPACQS